MLNYKTDIYSCFGKYIIKLYFLYLIKANQSLKHYLKLFLAFQIKSIYLYNPVT